MQSFHWGLQFIFTPSIGAFSSYAVSYAVPYAVPSVHMLSLQFIWCPFSSYAVPSVHMQSLQFICSPLCHWRVNSLLTTRSTLALHELRISSKLSSFKLMAPFYWAVFLKICIHMNFNPTCISLLEPFCILWRDLYFVSSCGRIQSDQLSSNELWGSKYKYSADR